MGFLEISHAVLPFINMFLLVILVLNSMYMRGQHEKKVREELAAKEAEAKAKENDR